MINSFQEAALFLVEICFEFYIMVLVMRLILHAIRAEFYNPLCQFVAKLTTPVVRHLQGIFPIVKGFDTAVVALIIVLEMLKVSLVFLIQHQAINHAGGLLIYAVGDFLDQIITLYFYAVLLQIILSWIRPNQYNPMIDLLFKITAPLMRPAQRYVPPIGGIDLSPIPVMIGLQLMKILLTYPVMGLGQQLALSS